MSPHQVGHPSSPPHLPSASALLLASLVPLAPVPAVPPGPAAHSAGVLPPRPPLAPAAAPRAAEVLGRQCAQRRSPRRLETPQLGRAVERLRSHQAAGRCFLDGSPAPRGRDDPDRSAKPNRLRCQAAKLVAARFLSGQCSLSETLGLVRPPHLIQGSQGTFGDVPQQQIARAARCKAQASWHRIQKVLRHGRGAGSRTASHFGEL